MVEQESKLIGMIYDAALDETRWSDVLAELVVYTESKTAIFVSLDQLNPEYDFVYSHQIPEVGLAAYQDERVKVIDMRLHTPLWQEVGVGGVINMDLSGYASMPQSSDEFIFYDKCLKPTEVYYITAVLFTKVQFACGDASAFQGAERDIIFLSMVADPENCHALSRSDHEQRFNVAASRARERMYLVHSVNRDHKSPKDLRLNLLNHFYDLQEDKKASFEAKLDLCESEFEKSVFTTLHKMGYTVTPQVKVGSYRIDLVVESDGDQRLAVECDGDSYHGSEQWHDDMIRQRALERAGWTFWRCFASSWEIERFNMIQSLQAKLNSMGITATHGMSSLVNDVEHKEWLDDESEMRGKSDIEKDLLIV